MELGPGPEFDRIRAIVRALGDRAEGLGDDCAVLPGSNEALCVSTDVAVEGVHFRLDWLSLEEAGWRAVAAALSDLAADGAAPAGVLTGVIAPAGSGEAALLELMRGAGAAAAAAGTRIVGGNLASGSGGWTVSVTVLGRAPRPVTRAGAMAGNRLWVTGVLGGARAALEAWRRGDEPDPAAREAFARPSPRLAAGRWLADHGARAMLDLSDGLAGDAGHLAAASKVKLEIELDLVPVHPATIAASARLGVRVQELAATGGEDYELLAAMPAEFGDADVRTFERATGLALTCIGRVVRGRGVRLTLAGEARSLAGFDHFR